MTIKSLVGPVARRPMTWQPAFGITNLPPCTHVGLGEAVAGESLYLNTGRLLRAMLRGSFAYRELNTRANHKGRLKNLLKKKKILTKITGRPTCGTKMHKAWWSHRLRRHSNNVYGEMINGGEIERWRVKVVMGFSGGLLVNLAACCVIYSTAVSL